MAEPSPQNPIRETDNEARKLGQRLLREARFATLATLDAQTGFPSASLVSLSTDTDGTPVILVSQLSAHTQNLITDNRASLLVGTPGKGDPLAHPRMTVMVEAMPIDRNSEESRRMRARYLVDQPKAQLYIDFVDFLFMRLEVKGASLNGGFGKAYRLQRSDLCDPS
jgi:heme iron utilization protein